MKLKLVDLCAGTGAFSWVLEKLGYAETVFANDFCGKSKVIYDENFDIKMSYGDITKFDVNEIPDHDILTAGFPCQPFSISGKREGFEDERSNVFWTIIDILSLKKPKYIILENVKNLRTHDNGKTFEIIVESLTNLGYYLKYDVINTAKVTGVPQHRERIYIVGFLDECEHDKFDMDFPEKEKSNIIDYLENEDTIDDKYYYTDKLACWPLVNEYVTKDIRENVLYQFRRVYVRENKSNECPTLTANMGGGGHNVPLLKTHRGIRKLTPRECFNLQGFPNEYVLSDKLSNSALYKLAGNAVSIPVVELIAHRMFD